MNQTLYQVFLKCIVVRFEEKCLGLLDKKKNLPQDLIPLLAEKLIYFFAHILAFPWPEIGRI